MGADTLDIAPGRVLSRVRAEVRDGPLALGLVTERAEVTLDPRLAQTLSRTECELRHGRRLEAEQRRDVGGLQLLDLGVPEDFLPAGGKAAERAHREGAVEGVVGGLLARRRIGDEVELVVGGLALRTTPSRRGVSDRREQVRPKTRRRPFALADRLVDRGEGFLDEIVRVERSRHRASRGEPGSIVPSPELAVCVRIAGTHGFDQRTVGERGVADGVPFVLQLHSRSPSDPRPPIEGLVRKMRSTTKRYAISAEELPTDAAARRSPPVPRARSLGAMRRRRMDSSAIATVGYDEDISLLEIEFTSGEVYRYFAVPPSVVRGLWDAESAGRYFGEHIRGVYPERHIRR